MLYSFSLAAAAPIDITDSTAWVNLSTALGEPMEAAVGNMNVGAQALKIHAQSDTAATTATLALLWVRNTGGVRYVERALTGITVAAGARRTGAAGASGGYVCTVVSGGVTDGLIDLCPYAEGKVESGKLEIWLGQVTLTGGTFTYQIYSTRYVT